jgi:hypothetical protein
VRSGNAGRRARLRVGTGAGHTPIRRTNLPDHAGWLAVKYRNGKVIRRIKGCARLRRTANRTEAVIGPMVSALIAAGTMRLGRIMGADFRRAKGIGGGDGSGPARRDRCQHLHRQRDQKDRKKLLQLPSHRLNRPYGNLIIAPGKSRDRGDSKRHR